MKRWMCSAMASLTGHRALFCLLTLLSFMIGLPAAALTFPASESGITVSVDKRTGIYTITTGTPHWVFRGGVDQPLGQLQYRQGTDRVGAYHEVSFSWRSDNAYTGSIRYYNLIPVVLFSLKVPAGAPEIKAEFPVFTKFPASLHTYSFANQVFAPHQFKLNQTSTPWLFFDDRKDAFIVSPASDFMVAKMTGNGVDSIASGLNPLLKNLPDNFTHQTILVTGQGIGASWATWGNALMKLYGKKRPASDADAVLKYFGYWTDNGADYYYNYDTTQGYAHTLLSLRASYRQEGIPLGYMQLDSWWYDKSIYDPDGRPDADHKNKRLPEGPWNRYGGTMEYRANQFLFPKGLAYFQGQLGLPLVVHGRWIDPASPYHKRYKISGFAAVDPAYWKDIVTYLKSSGVICYEQDWLNYIYNKTPEMQSSLATGNAFTDGMANACKTAGLDMQYCMPLPCFYLQGIKYANLTTIRPSSDRFEPKKWRDFLYNSEFAYAIGSWPWCDVFKSHETPNMILAILSAGAVGTGDKMGKEDQGDILMVCRTDGVLVKPDAPAVPLDASYLNDATDAGKPMVAWTYTRHGDLQTDYVFAFTGKKSVDRQVSFKPADMGMKGSVVVYNPLTASQQQIAATDTFTAEIGADGYVYYMVAPVTPSGIAFLGDAGKFVGTGKKRIASLQATGQGLQVSVEFAKDEEAVTLQGYYEKPFKADKGILHLDEANKHFTLELPASKDAGYPVRVHFTIE